MKQIRTNALRTNQTVPDSMITNNSSSVDPSALMNLIENQRITIAFEKCRAAYSAKYFVMSVESIGNKTGWRNGSQI
ncbi:Uncharacterized protein BM_BM14368 [Brugia malayi]|uniref:Bm14368 n=1 Tax=Brugia malayi TaxID=6279 RepID=A0A0K0J0Z5_BRUMA|nr:Uncharacterized protein BM_BM14368 [Brugia malayi]CDQ02533.1 Bm14368 [Brugia malayi]VIO96539.1 Uncharacterized protein BM_BM14368 [Brugia malayi]